MNEIDKAVDTHKSSRENTELKEGYKKLKLLAYQVKQQEELIDQLERGVRDREREVVRRHMCCCGHERRHHGKSFSVNYTDGACIKCGCHNFLFGNVETK